MAPVAPQPAPAASTIAPAVPQASEPAIGKLPVIALNELEPDRWIDLFLQLPLTGVARNIAANSVLTEISGKQVSLVLEDTRATLYNDEHRKRIETVLSEYFAAPLQLRIDIGPVKAETPAAWRQRREAERKEAARKAFTEDAVVRAVVERFGAEIQYDSITLLNPDNLH